MAEQGNGYGWDDFAKDIWRAATGRPGEDFVEEAAGEIIEYFIPDGKGGYMPGHTGPRKDRDLATRPSDVPEGQPGSLGHPYDIENGGTSEAEAYTMAEGVLPPGTIISFRGRRMKIMPDGSLMPYTRRRRKRMLTCSDKADIAFLKGQLGTGALGQSAISALLANCRR